MVISNQNEIQSADVYLQRESAIEKGETHKSEYGEQDRDHKRGCPMAGLNNQLQ